MMSPKLTAIYRYPVKGLSPQRLDTVELTAGETVPFDRAWAIENGPGRFDEQAPKYLPKISFLMLMRNEKLATLQTEFDEETLALTILRAGRQVARGNLGTKLGRQMIEQFFAAYMKDALRGAPRIISAPGHSFSDVATKCLHIINLATLAELERSAGRSLDPLRFRANLYIDGLPAWSEFGWIGKEIQIGQAKLKVFDRTTRCDATNVDPSTGARDTAIPAVLQRRWSHSDFGVYARVTDGGPIAAGDDVASP
jgi:uncharacterized protein YcbX